MLNATLNFRNVDSQLVQVSSLIVEIYPASIIRAMSLGHSVWSFEQGCLKFERRRRAVRCGSICICASRYLPKLDPCNGKSKGSKLLDHLQVLRAYFEDRGHRSHPTVAKAS